MLEYPWKLANTKKCSTMTKVAGVILLYYLQVGGYSAENFFEARSNFNEIMLLELFNQGIGLQVCSNTSNFCHGATFFCICQLPCILEHD
jgi:hypothetical protein